MKLPSIATTSNRARWRLAFLVLSAMVSLLGLSACAGTERPADNTAMLPEDQRINEVPWSQPAKWESTGQLGQIANDPRFANH